MQRTIRSKSIIEGEGQVVEKPTLLNKRRALGDITNSSALTNEKESSKKIALMPAVSIPRTSAEDIMGDVDSLGLMDDRPYMKKPADNIDAKDAGNILLISSYVNQLFDHFEMLEKQYLVNPNYMNEYKHINAKMRAILIDWLIDVHFKFRMVQQTIYMTVSVIDRYLQFKEVTRSRLQLVGIAALYISAKYEEIYVPEMKELIYLTDRTYTKKEILDMEADILTTLNYEFTVPTVYSFLGRYLKAAHADHSMVELTCYIAERTLQEYSMLKYPPSMIAATAVYIVRKNNPRYPWSSTLVSYTKYDEMDLLPCLRDIETIFNTPTEQRAVIKKYSTKRFANIGDIKFKF